MSHPIKHVVILGGGSAGWLTAGILASQHCTNLATGLKITLIESSDIPTIGVGEGTWPTMRETLSSIGISEKQFISCCDASFKQGSQFINWQSDHQSNSYYHPFVAPHGFGQSDLVNYWQTHCAEQPFAHALSFQPHLCDHHKAPKQQQTPEYAAVANYGYHLDAGKFATLLKEHCIKRLGVKHIVDTVAQVKEDEQGYIQSLTTEKQGDIQGQLFIDCSGLSAHLIGQHYKIEFNTQKHILFNDTALAIQVEHQQPHAEINSHTLSTAHDGGWIWDIGLPTRRGIGCVYSSEFTSDDQAEQTLRHYLSKQSTAPFNHSSNIRKLSFTPGYREKMWHKNCVAIGMSSGFIEPLEASALALIELSAKMVAKELPADRCVMEIAAQRYNSRFEYRWQRIIEFLKLHYVLSQRKSDYWQANRESSSIPLRLQQLLTLWQYQEPTYNDFTEIEEIFPAASYQYILYGMGFSTASRATTRRYQNTSQSEQSIGENRQLITRYLEGLPTNRELINFIRQQYQNQHQG